MKPFGSENILLCDNQILVADKPAEIATQPDLTELVRAWVKKRFNKSGNVFLEPIHRLDKPVTGIVLFARTSKALSRLQEEMRERRIKKNYVAWVEGSPQQDQGELRHMLVHGSHRAEVSPEGKEAILEYQVIKKERGRSKLHIRLHTGRYHQIRAQMAAIGCPVVGDTKYGSKTAWDKGIALYAQELSFKHPVSHELVTVVSQFAQR
jgi:23S rRNA pseudouridine1911/1915/1917 synthase